MNHLEEEDLHYDTIGEIYDIPIEEERLIWEKYYINKIIMVPDACPKCNSPKVSINNNKSVLNPLKGSCNNKSYKNRYYLRQYSFLNFFYNYLLK